MGGKKRVVFPWHGSHGTKLDGNTLWDALWPRPGCLGRKDKLPGWTPRLQTPGKRAGVGAVVFLGQWGSLQVIARI